MAVEFFPLINCLVMKNINTLHLKTARYLLFVIKWDIMYLTLNEGFFQIRKRGNFVNTKRGRQYQMFDGCRILSFLFLFR